MEQWKHSEIQGALASEGGGGPRLLLRLSVDSRIPGQNGLPGSIQHLTAPWSQVWFHYLLGFLGKQAASRPPDLCPAAELLP